jgi:CheY-like chemotaxis protein
LNLALNARHAMDEKGKLVIRASNVEPGSPDLPGGAPADRQYVLIEMIDTGVGMAPEVLQRAFEPFFTTKPRGQGTGLGLSMAYGFAKQNGGDLLLDSSPGRGTRVKLFLPRAHGEARVEEEVPREDSPGGAEAILVVEDEAEIRSATVRQLTELGYRVLQAADAAEALRVIESGEHVDLLFCDVVMPGSLRSTALVERVRTLLPEVRVLFTSGYSEGVLAHQGQVAPGVHLLQKPYGMDALSRKIRQLLGRAGH